MTIVSGVELLGRLPAGQHAIPAFDVAGGNIDMLHAVCRVLREERMVAFLASTPTSIRAYHSFDHFVWATRDVAAQYDVVVAPHLDHATEREDILAALEAGFTSVMYDGSKHPYAENLRRSQEIVALAHQAGASAETELGIIGGKEDDISADVHFFPTLDEALAFSEGTGTDWFAPAIGTQHGFYAGAPTIQWDLAAAISQSCSTPLVLHGATGLDDDTVQRLLVLGFCKVNFATGIRAAFLRGIRASVCYADDTTKPQSYLQKGREEVEVFARQVCRLLAHKQAQSSIGR